MDGTVKIGIVGCGAISPAYLANLKGNLSNGIEVCACSDLNVELAEKLASDFGIAKACSTEELLADPDIDLVLNLTAAPAHYVVSKSILEAGKHLFTEKPLSLVLDEGLELLRIAESKGLKVGGAADTFLGAGLQVARKLLEDGRIGDVIAANTIVTVPLREDRRYHEVFKGAVLDLGPYYITALVHLFGPVQRVVGLAPKRFPEKKDGATGESFSVEFPSTASALLEFASGLTATVIASQDVHSYYPRIELLGTTGKMVLNDANFYTGKISIESWAGNEDIEPSEADGYINEKRGLGVAQMAKAIQVGEEPISSGGLMLHVIETLLAFYRSSELGTVVEIKNSIEQPSLLCMEQLGDMRSLSGVAS